MKRVAGVAAVLAVAVTVAIWGISRTFPPGPVTRLERPYVDAGPMPPPKPAGPRQSTERAEKAPPVEKTPPVAVIPPPRVEPPPRPAGSVIPVAPIERPAPREAKLPPPELRFETFEEVTDSVVYNAGDAGVAPPVVIYPQQLGRVPSGVEREDFAYVDVVINERGLVSQVKARQSPRTLDESMMITMSLSAAKTWRFEPALKDGRAVKYRQVIPVTLR